MKKILLFISMSVLLSATFAQSEEFSEFSIFADEVLDEAYDNEQFLPLMDMNQAKQDLVQLTRSYDELTESVKALNQRKKSTNQSLNTARISANATLQNMIETQELLSIRQAQVIDSLNKVSALNVWLGSLSQDIDSSKDTIASYSRFLFKTINDYFLTDDELSDIKLLAKSSDVARSLSKKDMTSLLYASLEQSFEKMNDLHEQYQINLNLLQSSISQYHEEIDLYEKDLVDLDQQRKHVDQLLDFLENDKNYIDGQLDRFEASQQSLQFQIDRIDTITTKTDDFLSQNPWVRRLLEKNDKDDWAQYFSRPVRVPNGTNDVIASERYPGQAWIVLNAVQGEEVYAPAPGIVYQVLDSSDAWLSRIILLHKYGYSTVIMPLSDVFVEQGALVERGEIIWLAWWKPWTPWAWRESVGAHTYFEVLRNGERIDPFLVMDVSVYQSLDDLAPEYHLKRKQDYLTRRVDLSDLPVLKGESPSARRDYFLSVSGNSIFSDPWLRTTAAKGSWIDPIFGICIWAAETSYRNFKSWNNIGNVGNNDRGDTVQFTAPIDGVRAVYQTLGNQYLWWYRTMDQLSRFGNTSWPIYASDPVNRQKNILRCLSMIYEVNMPEDYFLRVSK